MKKLTIVLLLGLVAVSLSSVLTYAKELPQLIEPIQVERYSENQQGCVLVPTAENPPFKIFSSVDIIYLAHSYTQYEFEQSGIKCVAKFRFPGSLTQQTNACPVIENVFVRGELAEAMCATLASALGSDFPRFELIRVKETKIGLELHDLVWQRRPPDCQCPQCPECSQDSEEQPDTDIRLKNITPSGRSLPPGVENFVNP